MSRAGLCIGQSSTLIRRTINPISILPSRCKWQLKNGYKEPSFDQKLLLAACEPIIPVDRRPAWDKCKHPENMAKIKAMFEQENPREVLLGRMLKEDMRDSNMIAFCHKNSMSQVTYTEIKNSLQHKDLWVKWYNRRIYDQAIRDTKFASLRPILYDQPNTVMVIAKGDADLKTLMQMEKKMQGFVLMCAFVEDRLIRKDEMITFSQIGSVDDVRAQLSVTLNHALAALPAHITHPATLLSLLLDQYVKREQDNSNKKDSDKEPDHSEAEKSGEKVQ